MSKMTIIEGNSNDKNNVRSFMVKGEKGDSAYDLYVKHGGTLTEEEWLESFLNANNFYDKTEVDNLLDDKADSSTTLAGYGITDAYTKAEVGDLSELETADKSSLVGATNEIVNFLNLNNVETITTGTITGGGTISSVSITSETNSTGTLAKIYGQIDVATNGGTGNVVINTSLRPTESMEITGYAYRSISANNVVKNNGLASFTIDTNGDLTIPYAFATASNDTWRVSLMACLIFIKDFGDIPQIGE